MKDFKALKTTYKDIQISGDTVEFNVDLESSSGDVIKVYGNVKFTNSKDYSVEIKKCGHGGGNYNELNFGDSSVVYKKAIANILEHFALDAELVYERLDRLLSESFKISSIDAPENYRGNQTVNTFFVNTNKFNMIWGELRNYNKTTLAFIKAAKSYKSASNLNELLWRDSKFINNKLESMIASNYDNSSIRTFFNMSVEAFIKNDLTQSARLSALDDSGLRDLVGCLIPLTVFEKLNPKYVHPVLDLMAKRISSNFIEGYKQGMYYAAEKLDKKLITNDSRAFSDFLVGVNFADIGTFKIATISPSVYSEPKPVAKEFMIATAPLNNEKLRMSDCTLLCNVEVSSFEALDNKLSIERNRMILKAA